MFVIYDEIRLDPSAKTFEVEDSDWTINPKAHFMQHLPTKTVFVISVDDKTTESEPLTMMDFSSRLVAIDRGCALPAPGVIQNLGRTAIVLYLVTIGYVQPKEMHEGAIPDGLIRNAYAC